MNGQGVRSNESGNQQGNIKAVDLFVPMMDVEMPVMDVEVPRMDVNELPRMDVNEVPALEPDVRAADGQNVEIEAAVLPMEEEGPVEEPVAGDRPIGGGQGGYQGIVPVIVVDEVPDESRENDGKQPKRMPPLIIFEVSEEDIAMGPDDHLVSLEDVMESEENVHIAMYIFFDGTQINSIAKFRAGNFVNYTSVPFIPALAKRFFGLM